MAKSLIEIQDLHVKAEDGSEILNGVNLSIAEGEDPRIDGSQWVWEIYPSFSPVRLPEYVVESGEILFKGENVTEWSADNRGKAGMFLAFQYPQEFPGVSVLNFLRQTVEARTGKEISILSLRKQMLVWMERLDIDPAFADRYLNEGFFWGREKTQRNPTNGITRT